MINQSQINKIAQVAQEFGAEQTHLDVEFSIWFYERANAEGFIKEVQKFARCSVPIIDYEMYKVIVT